jgi:hypothetical protein
MKWNNFCAFLSRLLRREIFLTRFFLSKFHCIFTGSSDRMPFQVMTNETAFVASAHPHLGAHWDWSGEETCMKMITLCTVMPCGLAERYHYIGPCCLHLVA